MAGRNTGLSQLIDFSPPSKMAQAVASSMTVALGSSVRG